MEGNDDMIEESKLPPKYWSLLKYAFSSLRVCVPVFGLRAGALEPVLRTGKILKS